MVLERWKKWLEGRRCRLYGHDEEVVHEEVFPFANPPGEVVDGVRPDGGNVLEVEISQAALDSYRFTGWRCRRCGASRGEMRATCSGRKFKRRHYVVLPEDGYKVLPDGSVMVTWREKCPKRSD